MDFARAGIDELIVADISTPKRFARRGVDDEGKAVGVFARPHGEVERSDGVAGVAGEHVAVEYLCEAVAAEAVLGERTRAEEGAEAAFLHFETRYLVADFLVRTLGVVHAGEEVGRTERHALQRLAVDVELAVQGECNLLRLLQAEGACSLLDCLCACGSGEHGHSSQGE